jgi:hypothetical protein
VQTALALTDAQKTEEKAIAQDEVLIRQLIFADPDVGLGRRGFSGGGFGGSGAAFGGGPLLTKLTNVTDGKLTALLTDAQQTQLKDLLGEPFTGQLTLNVGPDGGPGRAGGSIPLADPFAPPP